MRTFSVVATIVVGFMAAPTVSAQEPSSASSIASVVIVGTRVRLTSTALEGRPRGLVEAIDDSSLTLAGDTGPIKVPLSSIRRLETSLGKKRNTLLGLGIGLASGMLIALAMPVDSTQCTYDTTYFCSRGEALVGGRSRWD